MHIAEGVLSTGILCTAAGLTGLGTVLGLKRLANEDLLKAGILSALFFVASLIHIPIGVSSAHLIATGLLGVFLGWGAFPAILSALSLQAVFFQFGGLTVLGVNTWNMAFSAVLAGWCFQAVKRLCTGRRCVSVAGFLAGFLGVFFAALLTALSLAFSSEGFSTAATALFVAHVPIMLAEGLITMFTLAFIARVRPELLP